MRRAVLGGAAGGVLAGLVLGVGAYVFSDGSWFRIGPEAVLLLPPFALTGALLGGFCAYVICFGCRELARFSDLWGRAFRDYRLPILCLIPAGALAAVLSAGGVPVSPGMFPLLEMEQAEMPAPRGPAGLWHHIEVLQVTALEQRELRDGLDERFQRFVTRAFFALLPEIHTLSLVVFGATVALWCALVLATSLVSWRAGSEAVFWSLWLLAGGFFLGIVTIGGFGYAFQVIVSGPPGRVLVYSIWSAGVPASWIVLAAAAGNVFFGLFGLEAFWRSVGAGLLSAANAGAILVLGTTTRWTAALGLEVPAVARIALSYFEGRLVDSHLMFWPAAPLVTLGVVIGVGLGLGSACYGMNVAFAERQRSDF